MPPKHASHSALPSFLPSFLPPSSFHLRSTSDENASSASPPPINSRSLHLHSNPNPSANQISHPRSRIRHYSRRTHVDRNSRSSLTHPRPRRMWHSRSNTTTTTILLLLYAQIQHWRRSHSPDVLLTRWRSCLVRPSRSRRIGPKAAAFAVLA